MLDINFNQIIEMIEKRKNNAYRKVCVTINSEEYSMRELTAIRKLLDAKLNNQ